MAIDNLYFQMLATVIDIKRSELDSPESLIRIGCLSYPDLLVTRQQISNRYPDLRSANFKLRQDYKEICKWHGFQNPIEIIETNDFFNKIDCNVDYFDFAEIRGGEIVCDLNVHIDAKHHSQYDLVVDTGTLEHCFNVGVAFENMCRMVNVGGLIISAAPMSKVNHGFWNFSPCAYENYFRQNNFDILQLTGFYKDKGGIKQLEVQPNQRQIVPQESFLVTVARRKKNSSFKLPIQQKYL